MGSSDFRLNLKNNTAATGGDYEAHLTDVTQNFFKFRGRG